MRRSDKSRKDAGDAYEAGYEEGYRRAMEEAQKRGYGSGNEYGEQTGGDYGSGEADGGYGDGYASGGAGMDSGDDYGNAGGGYGNGYASDGAGYGNADAGYGDGYASDGAGYGNADAGYGNGYDPDGENYGSEMDEGYGADAMRYDTSYPQDRSERAGNGKGGKKSTKKNAKKKKRRKLVFVLELLLLLVAAGGIFVLAMLNRVDREKLANVLVNTGVEKSGYRNIALFGVDSREGNLDSDTRSDTIMVASINNKTGEIRIVSVYRDTYLATSDDGNGNRSYHKATECYQSGGAEGAVNMLNRNLDLDITDFVTVDFSAVIEVVDALGGIDIELTDEEVQWLNAYLVETSEVTGKDYTEVTSSGTNHLTGIQAMAYCRIRYTTGWDYKRTERQRLVLEQIFKQAQAQGVVALASVVNQMIPYIKTSLSNTEMLALAANIASYSIGETTGFPFDKTTAELSAGDCVVPVNLANNVTQLHEFLFDDTDYTPSETVQTISNEIINATGIQ